MCINYHCYYYIIIWFHFINTYNVYTICCIRSFGCLNMWHERLSERVRGYANCTLSLFVFVLFMCSRKMIDTTRAKKDKKKKQRETLEINLTVGKLQYCLWFLCTFFFSFACTSFVPTINKNVFFLWFLIFLFPLLFIDS